MTTFTVTTWNLENLFLPGTEFGPKTEQEYADKLGTLAATILELAPDVMAVQEVGGSQPLADLVALLDGCYPFTLLSTHPDARGIRVGFISKLAFEESEELDQFPESGLPRVAGTVDHGTPQEFTSFGRGALAVSVQPEVGLPIRLITGHLKSKLLSYPAAPGHTRFVPKDEKERVQTAGLALLRRTAEAVALRAKANEILEGNKLHPLIVLGDMNDGLEAATTQILLGPGGSQFDAPAAFDKPDKGDDARLFNLGYFIPEGRRYSRNYQGHKELIDHILVSEELLPGQPRRRPAVDTGVDLNPVPTVGDVPAERRGKPGSDHAPVTATFVL